MTTPLHPDRKTARWIATRAAFRAIAWLMVIGLAFSPASARREWYDHYEGALQALDQGDPEAAIQRLRAALDRESRSGYLRTYGNNYVRYVPHFYMGVAYHDAGDCTRALESFARSTAAGETDPEPALAARLQALRSTCEKRLAPPPVQTVETTTPPEQGAPLPADPEPDPDPEALMDPTRLEAGLGAYLAGDLTLAVAEFERLVGGAPRSARAHLLLGMALHGSWSVGGKSDAALLQRSRRELREARRLDPGAVPDPALCPPPVAALYRSLS